MKSKKAYGAGWSCLNMASLGVDGILKASHISIRVYGKVFSL